jgi:hypothetical protein
VVAGDVLAIINYVNAHPGQSRIPTGAAPGPPYLDTSRSDGTYVGDGYVAAGDALAVINWINSYGAGTPGPVGESAVTIVEAESQAEGLFLNFEKQAMTGPSSPVAPALASSANDTLNDLIAFLASDAAAEQIKRKRRGP